MKERADLQEKNPNRKVIVFGGDGFCGWPTSTHLSRLGYDVTIVDSLVRRDIDEELNISSLTPIASIETRLRAWREVSGKTIDFQKFCINDEPDRLTELLRAIAPRAIVHFAEQRAAPYSMISKGHKCYTISNNVGGTHNLLSSIVETGLDIHLVHLGTMGVYGYGDFEGEIPEGYLDVYIKQKDGSLVERSIVYPPKPGSIYHLTKTMDHQMFQFYQRNDDLRITDLHQGIVWGTQTIETKLDERLINRFDYDGEFGTVLNRFIVQSAIQNPISVYGTGGQKRAFIHISDTVKCIRFALENPPSVGDKVKILNQITETHTVMELAKKVQKVCGGDIQFVENPRKELAENGLEPSNETFIGLGLKPVYLSDALMDESIGIAKKYESRIDRANLPSRARW